MQKYLELLAPQEPLMIDCLRRLVELETPTADRAANRRAALLLLGWLEEIAGAETSLLENDRFGPHLRAEWGAGPEQILLVGHFDTVHPVGTLARNPCQIRDRRMTGPGIYDMKCGLVQIIFALAALGSLGLQQQRRVVCLFNCDEELGSPTSRPEIERLAPESRCAFVTEPSFGAAGALKIARRGVGTYRVSATGKAAHAGNCPEDGVNAIEELCRQVLVIQGLTDPARGVYLNCGLITGGSAKNTVADWAQATVDLRLTDPADAERIDQAFRGLKPHHPQARLTVEGGVTRPPMVETAASRALFALAQELMRPYGSLTGEQVGGVSDGNLTSIYTPTLDGLGAVGGGAHALDEWIDLDQLVSRTALLAALIEHV